MSLAQSRSNSALQATLPGVEIVSQPASKRPHWREGELARLRELYPTTRVAEIARNLKRPESSIWYQAARLGLKRDPESYLFTAKHVVDGSTGGEGEIVTVRKTSRGLRKFVKVGRKWRYLHHHVWEAHHGPVPSGYLVRFRDNDPMHVCVENLYLVSAAELAASFRKTDQYVAARLSRAKGRRSGFDREMYQKVLAYPELIDLKRRQLELGSILRHQEEKDETPSAEAETVEMAAGGMPAMQDVSRCCPPGGL